VKRSTLITVCAVALAAAGGFWYWQEADGAAVPGAGRGGPGGGAPLRVQIARAVVKPMPVVIEATGTVEPEQSVTLRAQVSGVLESVSFKEGDTVQAGQLLFEIDPRTYQAQYNQALAALARDQAQLENAKVQQARLEPLLGREFITQQEYDVAVTSAKSLEATVEADRAAVEQAKIQLDHSRIRAPISGRTGAVSVKPGNLVTASTGSGGATLVTINRLDPILVTFSIPERQFEEFRRHRQDPAMRVEVSPGRGAPLAASGQVVFVDNAVSQQTGTVLLKTRVANPRDVLWPGQFVHVRVILTVEPDAVVVPEVAVQAGQQGPFVYRIEDGRVAVRPITISRQIGPEVVVASGLHERDVVVTEIPQGLNEGVSVQIVGDEAATRGGT
jgi:multidrug efflux system membrane fusion protein